MQTAIYVAGGIALALGATAGLATPLTKWYRDLRKPPWQPPNWLFGPTWTVLLACAAAAAVLAWNGSTSRQDRIDIITVFAVNSLFFVLWSPLFFVLRRPDWALVEVIFLWFSILALIVVVVPLSILGGLLLLPYLAWVSFASQLNRAIVGLNRPFGKA